jgi:hypothetical protein
VTDIRPICPIPFPAPPGIPVDTVLCGKALRFSADLTDHLEHDITNWAQYGSTLLGGEGSWLTFTRSRSDPCRT